MKALQFAEQKIATFEQHLNKLDWIPYLSFLSGPVRILAAHVQIVAGSIFATLKIFAALFKDSSEEFRQSWKGISWIFHGGANMLRGAIATFPYFNLILLVYDAFLGRFNYEAEKMEPGVYPLNLGYI